MAFSAWDQLDEGGNLNSKRPPTASGYLCGEPLIESEADALYVPGQELCDAIDRMIGDALDGVAEICVGIKAVGLGSFDQAVDRCSTLTTCIGTVEGPVAPAEGNGPHGALRG